MSKFILAILIVFLMAVGAQAQITMVGTPTAGQTAAVAKLNADCAAYNTTWNAFLVAYTASGTTLTVNDWNQASSFSRAFNTALWAMVNTGWQLNTYLGATPNTAPVDKALTDFQTWSQQKGIAQAPAPAKAAMPVPIKKP